MPCCSVTSFLEKAFFIILSLGTCTHLYYCMSGFRIIEFEESQGYDFAPVTG
ncbi:hypothetical protein P9265_18010 [Schinkia azotoformans]|uniref:hypothetical protein n=1 Tax=Schinkia azotoformans TaxID=1454 RepID=UPI0002F6155B|nr:hypothetical protein [Schinkia azotoformans]